MSDAPIPTPLPPLPTPARGVVAGFSGGMDSSVLLHLLAADPTVRARGLRAVHVHHGLHPDADAWARHCQAACDALGIALQVVRARVDLGGGQGREGAAREARLSAFASVLAPGEAIALAHHRDDQAETFLLRALRASGPDGLAAMRPWRRFAQGWLWRPLLDLPRTALQAHARAHALDWIEDEANRDTSFDRNLLRHEVLPLLRRRWPRADAAFARAAALQAGAADLLDAEDAVALATARTADPHVLRCAPLLPLPAARRARVLRRWIAQLGLPPLPASGAAAIEAGLPAAAAGRLPVHAWSGAVVRRWRDLLYAGPARPPLPATWAARWNLGAPLALPGGGSLALLRDGEDAALDATPLTPAAWPMPCHARARRGGERIGLPGRTHSHALKHVLQDLALPPWERERLPLLFDADDRLLAAGDVAYAGVFDAWLRANRARLAWTGGAAPA